jgi:transposase
MHRLKITNPVSADKIRVSMNTASTPADYKRWQIIHIVLNYDVDAQYLSDITGYSKASIYAIVQQHNNKSRPDVSIKSRGGRRRALISVEEESALMKGLEDKAMKGQILSFWDVKKVVEAKVGRSVSDDFIWDLFKRNGWTKHTPRPHHPNKDEASQEAFKKNSRTIWLPLKMILNQP